MQSRPAPMILAALLGLGLVVGVALAQQSTPAWPSTQPPHLTSDSVEFCRQLGGEVLQEQQAHPNAPPHVRALSDEGRALCEQGRPHRGIARLRWAMMLLRQQP